MKKIVLKAYKGQNLIYTRIVDMSISDKTENEIESLLDNLVKNYSIECDNSDSLHFFSKKSGDASTYWHDSIQVEFWENPVFVDEISMSISGSFLELVKVYNVIPRKTIS